MLKRKAEKQDIEEIMMSWFHAECGEDIKGWELGEECTIGAERTAAVFNARMDYAYLACF